MGQVWHHKDGAYDICFKLDSYSILMLSMWIYTTHKFEGSSQACEFEIFTRNQGNWTKLHGPTFYFMKSLDSFHIYTHTQKKNRLLVTNGFLLQLARNFGSHGGLVVTLYHCL